MKDRLYQGASWALGALLLYAILSAVRIGAADYFSTQAGVVSKESSSAALAIATRDLEWARRLTQDDPARLEESARLAIRQANQTDINQSDRQELLHVALVHARSAVALRPAYAYGWAIVLKLKHALREYDAEFRQALRAVMVLGPWEPGLQVLAVDAGMAAWTSLSVDEQNRVMSSYLRGMHRQGEAMVGILRSYSPPCSDDGQDTGCVR